MSSFVVHHAAEPHPDISLPDPHQDTYSRTVLGFWVYLMTDCIIFATLFITHAVLENRTFGGPTSQELFSLPHAFAETMVLLLSSVTCGFAVLSAVHDKKKHILAWLAATFLFGASFLTLELIEFTDMVMAGHGWQVSAFLSSFFTLVGTHGTHVSFGMIWMAVMFGQVLLQGITVNTFRRLVIFSLFWHFLDLVWIFIFTFVYLFGVI